MKIYTIAFSERTGFEVEEIKVEFFEIYDKTFRLKIPSYFIYGIDLNSIWFDSEEFLSCSACFIDKKMIFKYIEKMKEMVLKKIDDRIAKLKETKKKVKKFNWKKFEKN